MSTVPAVTTTAAFPARPPVRGYDRWFASAAATVPGTRTHAEQVRRELLALLSGLAGAARAEALARLEHLLHTARTDQIWALLRDAEGQPFPDWEAFCVSPTPHGLGLPVGVLDALLAEQRDPLALARRAARSVPPLQPRGVNHSTHRPRAYVRQVARAAPHSVCESTRPTVPGSRSYWVSRLKRDAPDVLADLLAGKFRSTRHAALAAGVATRTLTVAATPESFARQALRHLSIDDRRRLVAYLTGAETIPAAGRGLGPSPLPLVPTVYDAG